MSRTIFALSTFVAGVAAGVAFVLSCGSGGGGSSGFGPGLAAAQLNCDTYEVTLIDVEATYGTVNTLEAEWVPFGITSSDNVAAARCAK